MMSQRDFDDRRRAWEGGRWECSSSSAQRAGRRLSSIIMDQVEGGSSKQALLVGYRVLLPKQYLLLPAASARRVHCKYCTYTQEQYYSV